VDMRGIFCGANGVAVLAFERNVRRNGMLGGYRYVMLAATSPLAAERWRKSTAYAPAEESGAIAVALYGGGRSGVWWR